MPMVNFFKGELLKGAINSLTDSWNMILMATAFTINIDTHDGYANVSASELANGNGYVTGGVTLAGAAIAVDDVNDRADLTFNDAVWTASGGSIGPSPAAIIFDNTHASDALAGDIPFGSDQTATDGGTFTVASPTIRIA